MARTNQAQAPAGNGKPAVGTISVHIRLPIGAVDNMRSQRQCLRDERASGLFRSPRAAVASVTRAASVRSPRVRCRKHPAGPGFGGGDPHLRSGILQDGLQFPQKGHPGRSALASWITAAPPLSRFTTLPTRLAFATHSRRSVPIQSLGYCTRANAAWQPRKIPMGRRQGRRQAG